MAYIDSVDARGVESRTHTAEGQFESGRNGSLLCLAYTGVLRSLRYPDEMPSGFSDLLVHPMHIAGPHEVPALLKIFRCKFEVIG